MEAYEIVCWTFLASSFLGALWLGRHCDKKRADNERQEVIARARAEDERRARIALANSVQRRPIRRVRY